MQPIARQSVVAKPRILPGGIVVERGTPLRTYVPPARKPAIPEEEAEAKPSQKKKPLQKAEEVPQGDTEEEEDEGQPMENEEEANIPEQETQEAPPEEEGAAEQEEEKPEAPVSRMKVTKLASAERVTEQKTPEQLAQDTRMARMAEQLARIELQRPKEVAGKAQLPAKEEEIPKPPAPKAKAVDYEKAKEDFKSKMEEEEFAKITRQKEEEGLEQYAKENIVWLYEIFKMGGISREEFLAKVREKMEAEKPAAEGKEVPANPAFSNLDRAMEKKSKK